MTKHAEFPKLLYSKDGKYVTVQDQHEQDNHKGWSEKPTVQFIAEKGDEMNYATGEVADAKKPEQDVHAAEDTGADSKYGADAKHGVHKPEKK